MTCFFVGGINRSGTTLLQSILCSDQKTNPLIHEASYLRSITESYVFGVKKFEEHSKYYFDSPTDIKDFTAQWAKAFIDKIRARYPEAEHLVLKHPPLTARFPALFELLKAASEEPRFYIIVRDPRDVAASLVQVGEKLRDNGDPEGNSLPRNMNVLGNYYMQTYMPALTPQATDYKNAITLVKYEDLVSGPETVIGNIRQTSGLELNDFNPANSWKNDNLDYDNLKRSKNAWLSSLWGKQLSPARIGSYKNILTGDEIQQLEQVCAGPLKTFGYH